MVHLSQILMKSSDRIVSGCKMAKESVFWMNVANAELNVLWLKKLQTICTICLAYFQGEMKWDHSYATEVHDTISIEEDL